MNCQASEFDAGAADNRSDFETAGLRHPDCTDDEWACPPDEYGTEGISHNTKGEMETDWYTNKPFDPNNLYPDDYVSPVRWAYDGTKYEAKFSDAPSAATAQTSKQRCDVAADDDEIMERFLAGKRFSAATTPMWIEEMSSYSNYQKYTGGYSTVPFARRMGWLTAHDELFLAAVTSYLLVDVYR